MLYVPRYVSEKKAVTDVMLSEVCEHSAHLKTVTISCTYQTSWQRRVAQRDE